MDAEICPPPEQLAAWLGGETRIEVVEVARDTPDWALLSFWAHPERVLDPTARAATSGFARQPPELVERVVRDVERDLASGAWDARHGHLRDLDAYDAGGLSRFGLDLRRAVVLSAGRRREQIGVAVRAQRGGAVRHHRVAGQTAAGAEDVRHVP